MDKRFLAWLAVSMAVFVLYVQLFGPKPKPPEEKPDGVAAGGDAAGEDAKAGEDAAAREAGEEGGAEAEDAAAPDGAIPEEAEEKQKPEAADAVPPPPEPPLEFVMTGSVEPNGPYRMGVTFTNEGAAVRRLELSSPRFLDRHDRSGYLGHLELIDEKGGGAKVRIVGVGTPAEAAELAVGDVITSISTPEGDTKVDSVEDFTNALAETKPKRAVEITVRAADGNKKTLKATLRRRPLEIIRPEIKNYWMRGEEPPLKGFDQPPSFLLAIMSAGGKQAGEDDVELPGTTFRSGRWEIAARSADSVTFRKTDPALGLEVLKKYTVVSVAGEERNDVEFPGFPAYHVTLDITLRNTGGASQEVAYRLDGPSGLPTEGFWYAYRIGREWGTAGLRDVVARPEGRASMQFSASELAEEGQMSMTEKNPLGYAGVDAQYFASILLPEKPLSTEWFDERWALRLGPEPNPKKTHLTFTDVTCRLQRKPVDLEAGGELRDSYVVFCGPKRPKLLAKYEAGGDPNYNLGDLVYYGWPIWGVVARVMSGILHWFYGLVGNYGISILLLTVVVRLCMFPLSRKQALNMAKMQELKPEMDKINEKYKKDLEKRTKAQQELWRQHNYNPMGGCLLAFVQLPIFLGLYRALMVDIELRQAPLISDSIRWCSDLAAPDMLWNWSNVMPAFVQGWLGPYLNVLPLVTVGLFVAQQKLFMPPPMNEQAAMQQKMMSFMMIFIGFLFFKVASGLCIYFIASSLWGIAERKLLPKATVPEQPTTEKKAATTDGKAAQRTEKRQTGGTPQRNGHPAGGKKKTRSKRKK